MALKLFILGLPGSGKSSVARYIAKYISKVGWETTRINDYVILKEMFLADTEHKEFKPAEHEGFDVIDFVVCDKALRELERIINIHTECGQQEEIYLIEFARNDYRLAFQQFSNQFLHDAYILYLKVDLEKCKKRIRERIAHPSTEDDFYVSEDIFKSYYYEDDGQSIRQVLTAVYGIDVRRVLIIDNNGLLSKSIEQVDKFIDNICGFEP